jgi:hypothetical protein
MKQILASALILVLGACSPAAPSGSTASAPPAPSGGMPPVIVDSPNPTIADGAESLVEDLIAAGASAKLGSNFLAEPLPGEGVLVCIGTEAVQVYLLKDHEAALAAASTIDPDDPSKIGTSIVDWAGSPRFWLRDRMLVLYVGDNAATDTALRSLLGEPFAEARAPGRPPLPAPDCA